jgi:hypothetical protein
MKRGTSFAIRAEMRTGTEKNSFAEALKSSVSLQKEMPFRINRPTKMAVSDKPNA